MSVGTFFCPNCGKRYQSYRLFCVYCGSELEKDPTPHLHEQQEQGDATATAGTFFPISIRRLVDFQGKAGRAEFAFYFFVSSLVFLGFFLILPEDIRYDLMWLFLPLLFLVWYAASRRRENHIGIDWRFSILLFFLGINIVYICFLLIMPGKHPSDRQYKDQATLRG